MTVHWCPQHKASQYLTENCIIVSEIATRQRVVSESSAVGRTRNIWQVSLFHCQSNDLEFAAGRPPTLAHPLARFGSSLKLSYSCRALVAFAMMHCKFTIDTDINIMPWATKKRAYLLGWDRYHNLPILPILILLVCSATDTKYQYQKLFDDDGRLLVQRSLCRHACCAYALGRVLVRTPLNYYLMLFMWSRQLSQTGVASWQVSAKSIVYDEFVVLVLVSVQNSPIPDTNRYWRYRRVTSTWCRYRSCIYRSCIYLWL